MLIDSAKPDIRNADDFTSFYDQYAPKLWGLILLANLPAPLSEAILVNTLTKAWQQFDVRALREKHLFSRLLALAGKEGLPTGFLHTVLRPKR